MDRNDKKMQRFFEEKAEYPESKKKKTAATLRKSIKKKGKRQKFKKRWDDDTDNAPSFEKKLKGPSLDDLASSEGVSCCYSTIDELTSIVSKYSFDTLSCSC